MAAFPSGSLAPLPRPPMPREQRTQVSAISAQGASAEPAPWTHRNSGKLPGGQQQEQGHSAAGLCQHMAFRGQLLLATGRSGLRPQRDCSPVITTPQECLYAAFGVYAPEHSKNKVGFIFVSIPGQLPARRQEA